MRILNFLFVSFLILYLFQSCKKEDSNETATLEFNEYLIEEMHTQKIPAMSVVIFKEGNILHESYLGRSHIQNDFALESNHLFLMASMSKLVTSSALLRLHEWGHFSLDDNINDYLSFDVSSPNSSTPITFRMLLTHTSGIADGNAVNSQYYIGEDSPVPLDYYIENYLVPGGSFYNASENYHDFEPGTQYKYSNIGSALMAVLVTKVSSVEFNAYCKDNIFNPLGMDNTYWRLDESIQSNSTLVQPYNRINDEYEFVPHYTFTTYPSGGLRSTGIDMVNFINVFLSDGISNGYQLLNSSTINTMVTPQIPALNDKMGLSIFLLNSANNLWGYKGNLEGASTIVAFNPSTKVGAIIMTNQGDVNLESILVKSYELGVKL